MRSRRSTLTNQSTKRTEVSLPRKCEDTGKYLSIQWIKLMSIVLGIAAAYFLTIQSLKIELSAKAEGDIVETLDKKLANLEVILKETVVTKEQFYTFSQEMEARLARIEYFLADRSGENIGKR